MRELQTEIDGFLMWWKMRRAWEILEVEEQRLRSLVAMKLFWWSPEVKTLAWSWMRWWKEVEMKRKEKISSSIAL